MGITEDGGVKQPVFNAYSLLYRRVERFIAVDTGAPSLDSSYSFLRMRLCQNTLLHYSGDPL